MPPGHMQKENTPRFIYLLYQAIRCGWQEFASRGAMILQLVDQLLRMFDANAQGKRFCFDQYPVVVKELKDIACRMTGGEDHGITVEHITFGSGDAFDDSISDAEAGHFLF